MTQKFQPQKVWSREQDGENYIEAIRRHPCPSCKSSKKVPLASMRPTAENPRFQVQCLSCGAVSTYELTPGSTS